VNEGMTVRDRVTSA